MHLSCHDDVALLKTSLMTLNQYKIENYVIIASLKRETTGKRINKIPSSRLLISSIPGLSLRTHVESLDKPRDVNKHSQSLVNLISKDTHLVFSMYSLCINKECFFSGYKIYLFCNTKLFGYAVLAGNWCSKF